MLLYTFKIGIIALLSRYVQHLLVKQMKFMPLIYGLVMLVEGKKVVSWGHGCHIDSKTADQLTTVITIYTTAYACAATTENSGLVTWGSASEGGDMGNVSVNLTSLRTIYSTFNAFAAVTEVGDVITWGDEEGDSSNVSEQLTGVKAIYSTGHAFAAITENGVVTWGSKDYGGDSSKKSDQLVNVTKIFSTS